MLASIAEREQTRGVHAARLVQGECRAELARAMLSRRRGSHASACKGTQKNVNNRYPPLNSVNCIKRVSLDLFIRQISLGYRCNRHKASKSPLCCSDVSFQLFRRHEQLIRTIPYPPKGISERLVKTIRMMQRNYLNEKRLISA